MRNIPVWAKLALGLAVSTIITLAVAAAGYVASTRIESALVHMTQRRTPALEALGTLRNAQTAIQRAERSLLIEEFQDNPMEQKRLKENLEKYAVVAGEAMREYEALPGTVESEGWVNYKEAWEKWQKRHQKVMEFLSNDMRPGALALSMREARESLEAVELALDAVHGAERDAALAYVAQALPQARLERMGLLGAASIAVVLSLAFGLVLTQNINRPLNKTLAFAERVAAGDFSADLNVTRKDEIGQMAAALRLMVAELQKEIALVAERGEEAAQEAERARLAVEEAREAGVRAELSRREGMRTAAIRMEEVVDSLGIASQQLAAQVEQAAAGAREQTDIATKSAEAMTGLTSSVEGSGQGAERAAGTAEAARRKAEDGAQAVVLVARDILAVQERAQSLRVSMDALGKRAGDIGRIIGVIDDIADQTNLLALNAAIEAARAGDAGRGFAVVADEVRKLAEKTIAATGQVAEAVRGIQAETKQSLQEVDEAGRAVDAVTHQAEASEEALREILALASQTATEVETIAHASREQVSAGHMAASLVEDMHRVSQEADAVMAQSARAVADLAAQARNLGCIVEDIRSGAGEGLGRVCQGDTAMDLAGRSGQAA
jgi:methyl-accepting chemotaxis protein